MSGFVSSFENIVGAGVKGLLDMAEGYMRPEGITEPREEENRGDIIPAQPLDIQRTTYSHPSSVTSGSTTSSKISIPRRENIIQTVDVSSGWIHLQAAYLESGMGGQKKVRTFGLRNLVDVPIEVEIESDLGEQLGFWIGEDDKSECSPGLADRKLPYLPPLPLPRQHQLHLAVQRSASYFPRSIPPSYISLSSQQLQFRLWFCQLHL
jgi:hypothetical protein